MHVTQVLSSGSVRFRMPPHAGARDRDSLPIPQDRSVFSRLTVAQNLALSWSAGDGSEPTGMISESAPPAVRPKERLLADPEPLATRSHRQTVRLEILGLTKRRHDLLFGGSEF